MHKFSTFDQNRTMFPKTRLIWSAMVTNSFLKVSMFLALGRCSINTSCVNEYAKTARPTRHHPTAWALNLSLAISSRLQFPNSEARNQTWRRQIVYWNLLIVSLDSGSCFSCQIVSVNIYSLRQKAERYISRMNLFLHCSSSTPNSRFQP